MTVKELINKLLDCKMDADVTVLVEIDKYTIQRTLDEYEDYSYPLDDDIEVKEVDDLVTDVRIILEDFKPYGEEKGAEE